MNKKTIILTNDSTRGTVTAIVPDATSMSSSGTGTVGPAGPTGPTGPAGVNWRGDWTTNGITATYAVRDVVESNGGVFYCYNAITSGNNINPSLDGINLNTGASTYWQVFAQRGATGAAGANGTGGSGSGIVAANPLGWLSSVSYPVNTVVQFLGGAFICILANSNVPPTTDGISVASGATNYWALFASKGDHGATGSPGATGPTGPAGISWQGNWSLSSTYIATQAVMLNGSSWVWTSSTPSVAGSSPNASNDGVTPTNGWTLVAAKGATGPAGSGGSGGATLPTATYNGSRLTSDSSATNGYSWYGGQTTSLTPAGTGAAGTCQLRLVDYLPASTGNPQYIKYILVFTGWVSSATSITLPISFTNAFNYGFLMNMAPSSFIPTVLVSGTPASTVITIPAAASAANGVLIMEGA